MIRKCWYAAFCLAVAFAGSNAAAALVVSSASPAPGARNVGGATPVSVTFGQPVMTSTVTALSFNTFGRTTGPVDGTFSFSNGNRTVTLTPAHSFVAGEPVLVVLSHNLLAADGTSLRSAGYAYSFVIKAEPASLVFEPIDTMSNNSGERTRIYGAMATDLNHDGYPDLTTVNEVSADLRVFLNRADGTGLYHPWLQPAFPIPVESSPNEQGDFDRDGDVDIAVVSSQEDSVLIAMGNGDGTFGSPQEIVIGDEPHGVAVLDVDGDGDTDVAVSVRLSSYIALMLNNGSGVFGAPTTFDSGGNGEYGLSAADMNNDQITDLVVGARESQQIIVLRGNGNATFTSIGTQASGGLTWVVATGDLNGDGNTDVSTANSNSGTGSILLGNGLGGLSAPTTASCIGHCVSTDLGDLDGDGDLDWVLSSFGGKAWRVFTNNGAGAFSLNQQFDTLGNASCGIILDFDRDGDLDLALTDETQDLVILMQNVGSPAVQVPAMSVRGLIVMLTLLVLAGVWIKVRSQLRTLLIFCGILIGLAASPARAISLGQVDDFQDATTQGWQGGAAPTNIATGGPDGAGDRYLEIRAVSGSLGTNNLFRWSGSYAAAGVGALIFDLNNFGPDPVALRITLFGAGGNFTSTNEAVLAGGSGWASVVFGLSEADLTRTEGIGTLAETLANVNTLLIRHDSDPISRPGERNPVTAVLGIDNVTAVPEPGTAPLLVAGLTALAATRRRR